METVIFEKQKNGLVLSTDTSKLDIAAIHLHLSTATYWAHNIPIALVKKSIENSLCFGIYDGITLVGFARVVTDYATFAWISDVYVVDSHKGRGLSKWLIKCIMSHPDLQGLRRWILATRDAHGLYAQYGFKPLAKPEMIMEINKPNPYD
jgi:GNAT superfamily N-acetyltransferase